mgnify:CR=1 FL=1
MTADFRNAPLDDWEVGLLVQHAAGEEKLELAVTVLLDTGLRISEFAELCPADVYWDRSIIVVRGKKGRDGRPKLRQVPLTAQSAGLLRAWFVTHDRVGYHTSWWYRMIVRLAQQAGILRKLTPHILRHTFAVRALRSGVDIRSVQQALGHATLSTTELYLKYVEGTSARAFRDAGWGAPPSPGPVS